MSVHDPSDFDFQKAEIGELWGDCIFANDSFTIVVDVKRDTVFYGQVESLLFCRQKSADS